MVLFEFEITELFIPFLLWYLGVLFKLSVKIGVLLVLLEYSYDCNYDAMEMLLEIAKLLPLSTTAVTNIWLLILDICQYLQPEPVSIEKLYYFGKYYKFYISK